MTPSALLENQNLIGIFSVSTDLQLGYGNSKALEILQVDPQVNSDLSKALADKQLEKLRACLAGTSPGRIANFVTTTEGAFDLLVEQKLVAESIQYMCILIPALSQEQILRSIGQVAGKYGHDLNNLLGSMRGVADLLQHKLIKLHGDPHPLEKQIQLLQTAINRSEELTRQMRGYVRYEQLPRNAVNLRTLIAELLDLTAGAQKQPLETIFVCTDDFKVHANEFQLTQAFQAIISNSLDAVSKFKERCLAIIVSESTGAIEQGKSKQRLVEVVFIDHGKGMSAESLNNALQALTSRKSGRIGSGLGLGLPMARQIIVDHGGSLTINSKEDTGTAVSVMLPLLS